MVYLIYGNDINKINYYLDKIKLENLDSEKVEAALPVNSDFITQTLYTPSLFSEKRLVILSGENFSQIDFEKIPKEITLVILQKDKLKPKPPKFDNLILIEAKRKPQIFHFLDNLIFQSQQKNLSEILELLQIEDANFIFHQLITHFRRLILIKNGNQSQNLANWQVKKYQAIAQKVDFEKLKSAYQLLLAAEIEVKTGQKELKTSLPILILKLTQNFSAS